MSPPLPIPDQCKPCSQAESWLLGVVNGTPVATFVMDAEHGVTHWNRACEILTGVQAQDVLGVGRVGRIFYPTDPRHPVMADLIIDQALDGHVQNVYGEKCRPSSALDNAWEVEDFFPHFPDGGKWLAFSAAALRSEDGGIVGAIETIRDVTQERRSQEALRMEKQRLSEIVNGCSVPIFVLDETHTVTYWNRACEIVTGTLAKDVVGTTRAWSAFYPTAPDHPVMADLIIDGKLDDQVNSLYAGKCKPSTIIPNSWEAEDLFPHFPYGCKWLAFSVAALRDSDGRIIGAVETLRDITQEKQAMAALQDLGEAQKATIHHLQNEFELAPLPDDEFPSSGNLFEPLL